MGLQLKLINAEPGTLVAHFLKYLFKIWNKLILNTSIFNRINNVTNLMYNNYL